MNDVKELQRSLELASVEKDKQILLAGDFNCPDIDWQTSSVKNNAQDREVQQALLDLSIDFNLIKIHNEPTRENKLLDLVVTTNSSLINSSLSTPGISDYDIVMVDSYAKSKPRKRFLFKKASWNDLETDILDITNRVVGLFKAGTSVHELGDILKVDS